MIVIQSSLSDVQTTLNVIQNDLNDRQNVLDGVQMVLNDSQRALTDVQSALSDSQMSLNDIQSLFEALKTREFSNYDINSIKKVLPKKVNSAITFLF